MYSGFYPYGEEKRTATANDRVKFGTYGRDGNTGLDYAENRYYSTVRWGGFCGPTPTAAAPMLVFRRAGIAMGMC